MQTFPTSRRRAIATALLAMFCMAACDKPGNPKTAGVPTDQTTQATTPPPPGDSTPEAADSKTRVAAEANEKPDASQPGSQTTVGTAASGAPPYSLQGAPEGNPAPKGGEDPKK